MSEIYTAEDMRKWDQFTIENTPLSSINLMERAAILCTKHILGSFIFKSVGIICGKGNNGGDGLAIARLLEQRGIKVRVYICETSKKGSPDFETNLAALPKKVKRIYLNAGDSFDFQEELLIDAIFGTGLSRPIDNWIGLLIDQLNRFDVPKVSIDLPSGLLATDNSKNLLIHCVKATKTLTFQTPKFSFFHAEYSAYVGEFTVLDIALLDGFKGNSIARYLSRLDIDFPEISHFAHKGTKGYLTLIAGNNQMLGSAILSSKSAFKTGCGYVGLISTTHLITPLAMHLPEAIWLGETWEEFSQKSTAIAIGPGIGQSDQAFHHVKMALNANLPLVIDADALNIIAAHPALWDELPKNSIITPHLGELERLIGVTKSPEERLERQIEFSIKYGIFILQKGAYSKLTDPTGKIYVNSTGNSGMASAGMGDALTGMIGSFLAQGIPPLQAAINGMYFHGLAGDFATRSNGKRGLLTSDLIDAIPAVLNHI